MGDGSFKNKNLLNGFSVRSFVNGPNQLSLILKLKLLLSYR
jgi:hypothetical protein